MKLSEQTVSLLKTLQVSTKTMQFKSGNKISTISPQKNILVRRFLSHSQVTLQSMI